MSVHDILSNYVVQQTEAISFNGGEENSNPMDMAKGTVGLTIVQLVASDATLIKLTLQFSDLEFSGYVTDDGTTGNFMYIAGLSGNGYLPTKTIIESGVTEFAVDGESRYAYANVPNPQGKFYRVVTEEIDGNFDVTMSATQFVGPVRFTEPGTWAEQGLPVVL